MSNPEVADCIASELLYLQRGTDDDAPPVRELLGLLLAATEVHWLSRAVTVARAGSDAAIAEATDAAALAAIELPTRIRRLHDELAPCSAAQLAREARKRNILAGADDAWTRRRLSC